MSSTASHKLELCSTACVFLSYPTNHRGFRCLDLSINRIILSRHVRFDEQSFPFSTSPSSSISPSFYDFLQPDDGISPILQTLSHSPSATADHAPPPPSSSDVPRLPLAAAADAPDSLSPAPPPPPSYVAQPLPPAAAAASPDPFSLTPSTANSFSSPELPPSPPSTGAPSASLPQPPPFFFPNRRCSISSHGHSFQSWNYKTSSDF